ncbi:MAG: hypothetical protein H6765_10680 [Candidatus Peribacteria bacterium]|nr:MAG: hypothetical protein H6765_10680 [Candidatus Peribacteria bacterium]
MQHYFYGINLLEPHNVLLTALACIFMYAQMQIASKLKPAQTPKVPGMGENVPDISKMM